MKTHLVADGESRLQSSEGFRVREKELHESIRARYAEQLAGAGFLGGCVIRIKIHVEYRREWRRMLPSRQTLYFWQP